MPKKLGAVEAFERLKEQYIKNKLPQLGFFSTMDELIAEAPFEKGSIEQWRNYLKPGRVLEREGVRFPLKKEELDYSWLDESEWSGPQVPLTKDELRFEIRRKRPNLHLRVGVQTGDELDPRVLQQRRFPDEYQIQTPGGIRADWENRRVAPQVERARYFDYAHETPDGGYEESSIASPDFREFPTHFGNDVISHSRTTMQRTPERKLVRLIEEIQSDRHQRAADRPPLTTIEQRQIMGGDADWAVAEAGRLSKTLPRGERRGYQQLGDEKRIRELRQKGEEFDLDTPEGKRGFEQFAAELDRLQNRVPDAPFKDPADYGMLELKNQLLNTVKKGGDYLGLVSGKDVSARFGQAPEEAVGTSFVYDKVYPSQLEKLARQYGAKTETVPIQTLTEADIRPAIMQDLDVEDMQGFVDSVIDRASAGDGTPEDLDLALGTFDDLLDAFKIGLPSTPDQRVENLLRDARTKRNNLRAAVREWGETTDFGEDLGNPSSRPAKVALRRANAEMTEALDGLWSAWRAAHGGQREEITKEFPAMSLTPEIRDKIRRVGVPIWSLTPATMLGLGANEEDTGFAEGGSVDSDLSYLKKIAAELAGREEGSEERNRRMNAGWASQMYGLDSEGKMSLLGGLNLADFLVPQRILESYRRNIKGEPDVKKYGPGLLDEVRSLFLGTQGAEDADARLVELRKRINEQLELDEAHGFQENFDEALGVMGGQLPVPGAAAAKLVPKSKLKALLRTLPEWFTPTVTPSPGNYISGATVGGGLGTLADEEPELPTERVRKAEGGQVEASDTAGITQMIGMLQHRLKMLSTGMPEMPSLGSIDAPDEPERLMKAEGGKVKTLLDLRKALAARLQSPNVEGTGKELQRLRDEVAKVQSQSVVPVAPERSTPESLIDLVNSPMPSVPSAPLQMSRRTALQGLASMLSPVDVPLNLKDLAIKQLTKAVDPEPRNVDEDFWSLNTFTEDEEPNWEEAVEILQHYGDTPEGAAALSRLAGYRDYYNSLDPETAFDDEGLVDRFHDWDDALQELAVSRGYRIDGESGEFELDDGHHQGHEDIYTDLDDDSDLGD